MRKKYVISLIILGVFVLIIPMCYGISRYGSNGEEVKEIQKKLKEWGYYDGHVDGIYGYKTYSAVKKFQSKNRLKADGIAGEKTLSALGINSKNNSNWLVILFSRFVKSTSFKEIPGALIIK